MKELFIIIAVIVMIAWAISSSRNDKARQEALLQALNDKYRNANPLLRSDIREKKIRVGMSEENVVDAWGQPQRRSSRMLKTKSKTTLHYGNQRRVHLDNGRVVGWDSPT